MVSVKCDIYIMHQKLSKISERHVSIGKVYLGETCVSCKCWPHFAQSSIHFYCSLWTQIHTCFRQIFVHW